MPPSFKRLHCSYNNNTVSVVLYILAPYCTSFPPPIPPFIQESCPLMLHEIHSLGTPQIDWHELEAKLNAVEGVQDVHDLHVWSISSNNCAMTVHVKVRTCSFFNSISLFVPSTRSLVVPVSFFCINVLRCYTRHMYDQY